MRLKLTLLFLVFSTVASSQNDDDDSIRYLQFDLSTSLQRNTYEDEIDGTDADEFWFIPDGISAKFGIGAHHNKWLALGIHGGIDFKGSDKLVAAPVFLNLRLAPEVGEETRLYAQVGFGYAFAIGRGDLSGEYRKISLGIENDGVSIFGELAFYGFTVDGINKVGSMSLGISLITF